ncbi:MAG: cell envelope integrity protein TolA [Pseudomonadales bacterium]|nr:MAG: cell envelope integrity protein TolA [Pseudomonadales bacterium]
MSERRERENMRNKTVAYVAAGLVHAGILVALLVNFSSKPKVVDEAFAEKVDVVKATTVDESAIQKQQDKLRQAELQREREKQAEAKRLERLKQQSEDEKKRIVDLQKQQQVETEKAAELERQRKAIALKKQREEEQRAKELAERKRQAELARQRKLEQERKKREQQRQEEEARRVAEEQQALETQRLLQESLAAEAAFRAEREAQQRTTTIIAKHTALIKQKVDSFRTIAPDFERWRVAEVNIKVSPLGEVLETRIVKSSGSERYDRSVESAILKASPLPIPDLTLDPEANNIFRNINYKFPMPGA